MSLLTFFFFFFMLLGIPPVPNPILESHVWQSLFSLLVIPILALEHRLQLQIALNPSLLQLVCKEACEPIIVFHLLRPSEVARYRPSAIREYNEVAYLLIVTNRSWWPIFIPRQILEKAVFQ